MRTWRPFSARRGRRSAAGPSPSAVRRGPAVSVDVDAVVDRHAASGVLREALADLVGDVVAAADDQVGVPQPPLDHARVELRQPLAVHVQDELRAREPPEERQGLRVVEDMDDVAPVSPDVQRDAGASTRAGGGGTRRTAESAGRRRHARLSARTERPGGPCGIEAVGRRRRPQAVRPGRAAGSRRS